MGVAQTVEEDEDIGRCIIVRRCSLQRGQQFPIDVIQHIAQCNATGELTEMLRVDDLQLQKCALRNQGGLINSMVARAGKLESVPQPTVG